MNVAEILSGKGNGVTTIGPEQRVSDAVALLAEHRIGALVVTTPTHAIVGMLSERDIVRHLATTDATNTLSVTIASVMSTTVTTCQRTDRVESLQELMTERRIRHLPVVDDENQLCGIVSIGDVVKSRVNQLQTEHDQLIEYVRAGQ